jgi:adenylate kinase family enzyme
LGKEVAGIMQSGALVPDELVNKLVEDRIERAGLHEGFYPGWLPAHRPSGAVAFGACLAAKGISPLVVHLKVDYNVIIARLSGRRQCPTCGAVYSVSSKRPVKRRFAIYDGSKLVIREDDRPRWWGEIESLRAANRAGAGVSPEAWVMPICEVEGRIARRRRLRAHWGLIGENARVRAGAEVK